MVDLWCGGPRVWWASHSPRSLLPSPWRGAPRAASRSVSSSSRRAKAPTSRARAPRSHDAPTLLHPRTFPSPAPHNQDSFGGAQRKLVATSRADPRSHSFPSASSHAHRHREMAPGIEGRSADCLSRRLLRCCARGAPAERSPRSPWRLRRSAHAPVARVRGESCEREARARLAAGRAGRAEDRSSEPERAQRPTPGRAQREMTPVRGPLHLPLGPSAWVRPGPRRPSQRAVGRTYALARLLGSGREASAGRAGQRQSG